MRKAAFFDLDDTLCDDATAWVRCARKAAALGVQQDALGIDPLHIANRFLDISNQYWLGTAYMSETRSIEDLRTSQFGEAIISLGLGEHPGAAALMAAEYTRTRSRDIDLFPDALDTLAHLRGLGVRLVLITNGLVSTHVEKVEHLGLEAAVDHVIIADAIGLWKPDARIFEHALELVGARSDEAVMVGDSLSNDVGGAQGAGVAAIWYNPHARARANGDPAPKLGEIRRLGELVERWESFAG
ncbi:MAG: HAD-IA family hydrolase [Capsulimonadaceae bacterium]|nr:HAD-IA family hydrolase [Capsulimonadaceae bacterium]